MGKLDMNPMSALADLEELRETFIMGLEIRFIQYENGQISESQLNDNGGKLHSNVKALSKAIDSLKCDKVALVRAKFKQLIRMTDFEYIDVNEVAVECAETLDQAIAIIDKEQS